MVSSEPLDSSPLLPLSAPSASGSFSLSASGSLQTHLSSFNSEQRLRSLPSITDDLEKQADSDSDDSDDEVDGDDNRQIAVKQRFWWLVKVFMWFSALFFPISVLGEHGFLSRRPSLNPLSGDYKSGYIPSLWENERLLSKITTLDLQPSRFRYSIFDGFYNSHDLTACIWFNLADFDSTLLWLREWPGPISLILSVDSPHDLGIAQISLNRLVEAPSNGTLPNLRISYLVYVKDSAGDQPNAYLNLVRLVSQTNHVVLFPKPLLELHSTIAYSHFYNTTHLHSRNTPFVLTASRKNFGFPFSPFSPLMVHRDDPTWCDERFDFLESPSVAWEECLWQFWIMKHGGLQPIAAKDPWKTALDANRTTAVFEKRLRDHFRDEVCLLAIRNTLALIHSLDDHETPSNERRLQPVPEKYANQRRWLKKHCRQLKVKGL
ncbi:hypothetical protein BDM02DRAFT_2228339 [Thelephora ganbajun]|uniref:Uncharacterized protein n=1 Tax=Thelephora ganbajun TaxID=370292 RepID=A0ACB6ZGS4_THEGA|nr:hypothetical protein BDM02DRAFT_2228339 [Thelephora ganbajun]